MKPIFIVLLAASVPGIAQRAPEELSSRAACTALEQAAVSQLTGGRLAAAETAVSAFLAAGGDRDRQACAGLVLTNMAAVLAVSGGDAEAERLAQQALQILGRVYPPDDISLLRPLQILAASRFEQGKTGPGRQAVKRMQLIRTERPQDSAMVHGMTAALLHMEGKRPEAEAEYLAAFRAWEAAGRGQTADAAAVLGDLASLYVLESRLEEARPLLDRALAIFKGAKGTVTMDYVRLLTVRGVLYARQKEWPEAEQDLREALGMADRDGLLDPAIIRPLMTEYSLVLRKNHHKKEARSIEARAAYLPADLATTALVDRSELAPKGGR